MLKEILGEDIEESPEEYHERLSVLTKEQLIAEMMRKKVSQTISHHHNYSSVNFCRSLDNLAMRTTVDPLPRQPVLAMAMTKLGEILAKRVEVTRRAARRKVAARRAVVVDGVKIPMQHQRTQ
jgi:hypothetical protein